MYLGACRLGTQEPEAEAGGRPEVTWKVSTLPVQLLPVMMMVESKVQY